MKIHHLNKNNKKNPIKDIGGKCAPFIELSKNKISIPDSYAIEDSFFVEYLESIDFWKEIDIKKIHKKNGQLFKLLDKAKKIILEGKMPDSLSSELLKISKKNKSWAVRSSANIEDAKNKSWAGGFESYIGINKKDLEKYIKLVWASVFTKRVVSYLNKPEDIKKIKMAILLQEAINPDVSGVAFSRVESEDGDYDEILIEAVHGVGEFLVQGEVTPDRYIVEREECVILEVDFNLQREKLTFSNKEKLAKISNNKFQKQKLNGDQIIELSNTIKKIENIYKDPRDIEWCIKNNKIYILQSRPITT